MDGYLGHAISIVTLDAVIVWMMPALMSFVIGLLIFRKGRMSLRSCLALFMLIFYLAFVFALTVFERNVSPEAAMKLKLFWSYDYIFNGDKGVFFEVFWNVVLFMPYGFLASFISKSKGKWIVSLSGFLMSVAIELTQLLAHRGVFEYDDIVHNTLGTIIGIALFYFAYKILLSFERKYKIQLI